MEIDAGHFPLIVVRWQHSISDQELERFIREINALAERAESERRHYAIVSIGDADFGPKQRKRIADWAEAMPATRKRWDLGNHVVLHGAVARGALTAIKWLTTKLDNIHVYPDEQSAFNGARAKLAAAGTKRTG